MKDSQYIGVQLGLLKGGLYQVLSKVALRPSLS